MSDDVEDFLGRGLLKYRFYEYKDPIPTTPENETARIFCCPCCDYPTLSEPAGYEICQLCSWEDDGRDGGGPNATSLEVARANFQQFLTSYGADHKCCLDPTSGEQYLAHEFELRPDNIAEKRELMQHLDAFRAEMDLYERGKILAHVFHWYPSQAAPAYHPTGNVIEVVADSDGWTRCPTCNFLFSARNPDSIAGGRHLRCGQMLDVIFPDSPRR